MARLNLAQRLGMTVLAGIGLSGIFGCSEYGNQFARDTTLGVVQGYALSYASESAKKELGNEEYRQEGTKRGITIIDEGPQWVTIDGRRGFINQQGYVLVPADSRGYNAKSFWIYANTQRGWRNVTPLFNIDVNTKDVYDKSPDEVLKWVNENPGDVRKFSDSLK